MDNIKNSFINQVSKLVKQYREYMMSVVHKTSLRVEPSHPEAYPLDEVYFSYPLSLTSMLRSFMWHLGRWWLLLSLFCICTLLRLGWPWTSSRMPKSFLTLLYIPSESQDYDVEYSVVELDVFVESKDIYDEECILKKAPFGESCMEVVLKLPPIALYLIDNLFPYPLEFLPISLVCSPPSLPPSIIFLWLLTITWCVTQLRCVGHVGKYLASFKGMFLLLFGP